MKMLGGTGDEDELLSEINITPLVDVMLVLLVMFIVTASAVTTAVHVNLPKTDSVAPPDAKQPIVLSVDRHGNYFIDKNKVTFDQLKQRLAKIHQKTPHKAAQLQADKSVPYGQVGRVMAALQASGIRKVAVLSKP
jgi:biopolymer transport protein ExbD